MRLALARWCAFALVGLGVAPIFAADQQSDAVTGAVPLHDYVCPNALLHGCPGHYCPKPMLCITPYCPHCGCDDYCCKPLPCAHWFCGPWQCCSYCSKPMPCLGRPLAANFYTCDTGCLCSGQVRVESQPAVPAPPAANTPDNGGGAGPSLPPPSEPR